MKQNPTSKKNSRRTKPARGPKKEDKNTFEVDSMSEAIIASFGDGVIIVNEYGLIMQINQTALDMLGYKRKELMGAWFPKALPSKDKEGHDIPTYERTVVRALLTGQATSEVVGYVKKDGSVLPVANTSSPFKVKGKPMGAIIIFRDFSREVQVEKAKDEFISITSHQLRSPLTSMRLFVELLEDPRTGALNDEQRDYLGKIKISTDRMLELVANFLSISKLELGRLEPKPAHTDLERLVNMQIAELSPVLGEKQIQLTFNKPESPSNVMIDAALLAEALNNLLTNAVRYAPPKNGKIEISVESNGESCIISVSDNGIGIPEEAKGRMFERFFRADNAVAVHDEGTGLGLYLVKKIVQTLRGRVWFESQENKGTTFYLSLPASKA
jgi:PAS domain S-box-containing protein